MRSEISPASIAGPKTERAKAGATDARAGRAAGSGSPSGPGRAAVATDAAQFIPFAALSGYYGLVREQERERESKRTLTEEHVEEVSRMLERLRKGDEVRVTHYRHDHYEVTEGTVRQLDGARRALDLQEGPHILFEDIWELVWA